MRRWQLTSKKILGLQVEQGELRMALLLVRRDRLEVADMVRVVVNGLQDGWLIENFDEFTEVLKSIVREQGWVGLAVVLGLPFHGLQVNAGADGQQLRVIVPVHHSSQSVTLSIRQEYVLRYTKAVRQSGLQVQAIEADVFALMRVVNWLCPMRANAGLMRALLLLQFERLYLFGFNTKQLLAFGMQDVIEPYLPQLLRLSLHQLSTDGCSELEAVVLCGGMPVTQIRQAVPYLVLSPDPFIKLTAINADTVAAAEFAPFQLPVALAMRGQV